MLIMVETYLEKVERYLEPCQISMIELIPKKSAAKSHELFSQSVMTLTTLNISTSCQHYSVSEISQPIHFLSATFLGHFLPVKLLSLKQKLKR